MRELFCVSFSYANEVVCGADSTSLPYRYISRLRVRVGVALFGSV